MPATVRTLSISRSTSAFAIASVGPIALFLIALILTVQARGVPDNDYWTIFTSMAGSLDGLPTLSDLYVRGNEHIIAGAKLFYLLNFHLTGGDNVGLSVIVVAFSLVIALTLSCAFSLFARSRLEALVIGIAVSLFVFSPLAAHNFFLGMSGIAWIGANLFTVLAALAFWRSAEEDRPMGYVVAIVLAAIASQFYSTGLTALCAIGIQGFCADKTRRLGILLFAVGLAYVILIAVFQKVPEYHAARNFDPTEIALFCLTFIGGGIVTTEANAIPLGAIGIGAAVLIVGFCLFRPSESRYRAAFWIAIMAYAVMSSGLAAIGRGNMGGDQAALSSRYATLPALFWIGLFGAAACLIWRVDFNRRLSIAIFALAVALLVMNGTPRVMDALARAEGKDFATLELSLGVKDPDLMQYVTSTGFQYYAVEDDLRKAKHVPFNGRDFGCPALGAQVAVSDKPVSLTGYIDIVSQTQDPRWARVFGWAADQLGEHPPLLNNGLLSTYRCIAFLDGNGTVVGLGLGGVHRADVAKALGRTRDDYGWSGYIDLQRLNSAPRRIYAVLLTSSGWTRLPEPEIGFQF
ncbi:hypothetical protein B5V01_03460 [Mesorhizobium erdmanii]|uniref:Uncharacterized protein n=2 Tax=Mesorhizobium TaxID=68287 RepID=A0A3M9XBA1_9HYPH|nr:MULTISPECIES: hypothetical protein [Mesorhizobium]RNJ45317.1 hypothetical protein DNR46_15850 [Mesorhizobium japonicum]RXT52119.1 hypothetical protein B5V01_03460 [Mesorhizobium erdmanii]